MGSGDIYEWDINQTGWAYRERRPDLDMALLRPETLVTDWDLPGTDVKRDVQVMMGQWERDALDLGIVIYDPDDLIERLTALLVPVPVRGGTYLYCPWRKRVPNGVMSCGVLRSGWATGTRFREMKDYRRHWRRCHLGGPVMPTIDLPRLYCPMGCGNTLHVMASGMIRCLLKKCPDPMAVEKLLSRPESHLDIVQIDEDGFSMLHPLRERVNGALFECPVNRALLAMAEPPALPGRYRATLGEDGILDLTVIEAAGQESR